MTHPRCALLFTTDGRDDLRSETIASFHAHALNIEISVTVETDDRDHEMGFCRAIREGWARLRAIAADRPFDYVFHLETDFVFERAFNVAAMARLLDVQPHLCQVALRRGPVNEYERQAGDDISMLWPDSYTLKRTESGDPYLEHRLNLTTNPCLYRRSLIERFEWPDPPRCEEAFGTTLIAEGMSFAYWGGRGAPWITHTGHVRTGHSY